jgi:hypothetical protein
MFSIKEERKEGSYKGREEGKKEGRKGHLEFLEFLGGRVRPRGGWRGV